jgi:hypothetical protein
LSSLWQPQGKTLLLFVDSDGLRCSLAGVAPLQSLLPSSYSFFLCVSNLPLASLIWSHKVTCLWTQPPSPNSSIISFWESYSCKNSISKQVLIHSYWGGMTGLTFFGGGTC